MNIQENQRFIDQSNLNLADRNYSFGKDLALKMVRQGSSTSAKPYETGKLFHDGRAKADVIID